MNKLNNCIKLKENSVLKCKLFFTGLSILYNAWNVRLKKSKKNASQGNRIINSTEKKKIIIISHIFITVPVKRVKVKC